MSVDAHFTSGLPVKRMAADYLITDEEGRLLVLDPPYTANLAHVMGGSDADLRAALTVSSILGLTIARHFLKLDALTNATDNDIARVARPWVTTAVEPATTQQPQTPPQTT